MTGIRCKECGHVLSRSKATALILSEVACSYIDFGLAAAANMTGVECPKFGSTECWKRN